MKNSLEMERFTSLLARLISKYINQLDLSDMKETREESFAMRMFLYQKKMKECTKPNIRRKAGFIHEGKHNSGGQNRAAQSSDCGASTVKRDATPLVLA